MEDIGYLSTSWNHLQDTIKAAEGLVNAENPDANEIEIMKRQLTDAMVKLVLSVDNEQLIPSSLVSIRYFVTFPFLPV